MPITMNGHSHSIPTLHDINTIARGSNIETMSQIASTLSGHIVASARTRSSCSNCLMSIQKVACNFFTHLYADVRMFFRAYSSLWSGAQPRDIQHRMNEVREWMVIIQNCAGNRNVVRERFERLSPEVRDLFFYVDENYINEFVSRINPSRIQEMNDEIIRECERVISFQQQILVVNALYRRCFGESSSSTTRQDTTDVGRTHRRSRGDGVTVQGPSVRVNGIYINIPDTVQYVQNAIPADVQDRASEINRLKAEWGTREVPDIYKDPVTLDFIEIPIFDASHPAIQNAMQAAVAPGATAATTAQLNNRNLRHTYDRDSLESHIQSGRSYAPAKCPTCRHPEHGGIRREYLRIDTALQNEILQHLRTHVRPQPTTR